MTKADRGHSTPPTNTSALPDNPARRGFLAPSRGSGSRRLRTMRLSLRAVAKYGKYDNCRSVGDTGRHRRAIALRFHDLAATAGRKQIQRAT